MKHSKELIGDLKPDQKKPTNRTTMGPTTDIDTYVPTYLLKQISEGTII